MSRLIIQIQQSIISVCLVRPGGQVSSAAATERGGRCLLCVFKILLILHSPHLAQPPTAAKNAVLAAASSIFRSDFILSFPLHISFLLRYIHYSSYTLYNYYDV